MKKIILGVFLVAILQVAAGQRTVTLWECYDSAAVATPLAREGALYSEMSALRERNLSVTWLPSLDLNGSFVYNSDIPDMSAMLGSLPLPPGSLPSIPHEQYRATFDINQVIWDGGVTRSAIAVEKVVRELNLQQNEADIYRLREQVNNYYFMILLAASQAEIIDILVSELDARIKDTKSGIVNGVVPSVTLDVLTAEKIKAGQSLTELRYRRSALISALESLTGIDDLDNAIFLKPEALVSNGSLDDNPDLKLFDLRGRQLEASRNLLRNQRFPKAFGFAQLGYGNPPGSNFFSEKADMYYSLGVGIKWNIFDWKKNSNERASLTTQQQLLEIRKNAAEEALQRMLTLKNSEIVSLREAAKSDEELVAIRKKIAATAASQLENGTITASQYLTELNGEKQAAVNAVIRQISISRVETEYLNITGKNK